MSEPRYKGVDTMERDRFSAETLIYVLIGVVFLVAFIVYYDRAFPTATVDLKVTGNEAKQIAQGFLAARGADASGYNDAVRFGAQSNAAVFLSKTFGMEEMNRLMRTEVPVWRWETRWFRSGEKEEYRVQINPDSTIRAFEHLVDEAKEGADLSQDEAQAKAVEFLSSVMGRDTTEFAVVESSSKKLDNRTDHTFVWDKKGFELAWKEGDPEAGTAKLRMHVRVQGDKVGWYAYGWHIPEKFNREFEKAASSGQLLAILSSALMVITVIASLVVFIMRYKRDDIRWRFALTAAIIVAVLSILMTVNEFPLAKFVYPTTQPYGTWMAIMVVVAVIVPIFTGLMILLTGAAGESLTREVRPASMSVFASWMAGRFFSRGLFFAAVRGYALGFFFLGYVTLFYVLGRERLGVYLMPDAPYSNLLGTYLPWLAPLGVAVLASVSEEFLSRLFSITFLKRYLRLTWLAVLIPAVIWAFGHSTYAVFPVYVRGIELTIAGVIFGIFFLRFNLMTCLIAHYAIDAILIAMPLLQAASLYYQVSGYVVAGMAAIPLLLGIWGLRSGPEAQPAPAPSEG